MNLTGLDPTKTYQNIVTTDRLFLYDGTGSLIDHLTIANFTSSHVTESFISASFITSSDIETSTFTASLSILPVVRLSTSMTFSGSNNAPQLFLSGDPNTGGQTATIGTSPAGMSLSVGSGVISFGNDISMGSHNIQSSGNASTFFGTASNASTASLAITASYALTASQGIKAWAYMAYNGSVLTTITYGCSASWIGTGSYGITLLPPAPSTFYSVTFNGYSGSTAALATASIGWSSGYTTSSFTMSVVNATSPNTKADFTTASMHIQSY